MAEVQSVRPTPAPVAGEMARRLRDTDWSQTPLGPIEHWPSTLRTAVSMCMKSHFPMYVWWGEHLINIYNDAYIPVLGARHPAAFGKPAREFWAELWPTIGANVDGVMQRGEAISRDRERLILERNGYPEETFFSYSHSPIPDGVGGVGGLFQVCIDETQRVLAERKSARLATHLRLALDAASMGWWHFDPATKIATWDERYAEIFGVEGRHLDNDVILKRLHPDDLPKVLEAVAAALDPRDPKPFSQEYRINRNGDTRWIEAHGAADFVGEGDARRAVSFVGTVADVTKRKRDDENRAAVLEVERAARAAADRASRMKDEFLATLSHELRTPLNAILGWSQIIKRGGATDANVIAQGIEVIERNARAQAKIIEDLLEMSRIISGKVRLELNRTDVAALVFEAIETARPSADIKEVAIAASIDGFEPGEAIVLGDRNRLQQVLWNLLSNAVKFTPANGRVEVRLRPAMGIRAVEIEVVDSGEGVAPDFLPYLFDRFRQADASTTRRHGGLGLGLSIVKQLTELHGGTVVAKSEGLGRGSSFTVTLPLAEAAGAMPTVVAPRAATPKKAVVAAEAPIVADDSTVSGLRVLVVDDDADALALVSRLLKESQALVTVAANAAAAFDLASRGPFDVLVSDIAMPGEDGHSLIRRIRELGGDRADLPAIALTAYARPQDRVKAIRSGFQLHLSKPIDAEELLTMVASLGTREQV